MAGSVNKVILVGNLGRDPEVRSFQSGDKVCNLSIATSESWKDRTSGERKERTEWHKVVIYNQQLIGVAERFLSKGSKVYLEGKLETRKYEKDGTDHYVTEVALRQFGGELTLLDGPQGSSEGGPGRGDGPATGRGAPSDPPSGGSSARNPLDDEIPF